MEVTKVIDNKSCRLSLNGAIDGRGADKLKLEFESVDLKACSEIIFDFTNVSYIGSAGLGKLLLFYKKASAFGAKMVIDKPIAEVRDLLRELGLDTLFVIH